jgi:hypothetical protein
MKSIFSVFVLLISFSLSAQTPQDTISIEYRGFFGGYQYIMDGKELSSGEVKDIIKSVSGTEKLIRASNRYDLWGNIFAFGGGLLVGGEIGRSLGGAEIRPVSLYTGIGLIITAFIFADTSEKRFRKAVVLYNDNVSNHTSWLRRSEVRLGGSLDGVGIVWRF